MNNESLGLIFVDGRMLSAPEAAAYIKQLKEENEKLKKDMKSLLEIHKIILDTCLGIHIESYDDDSYNKIKNIPE